MAAVLLVAKYTTTALVAILLVADETATALAAVLRVAKDISTTLVTILWVDKETATALVAMETMAGRTSLGRSVAWVNAFGMETLTATTLSSVMSTGGTTLVMLLAYGTVFLFVVLEDAGGGDLLLCHVGVYERLATLRLDHRLQLSYVVRGQPQVAKAEKENVIIIYVFTYNRTITLMYIYIDLDTVFFVYKLVSGLLSYICLKTTVH